MDDTLKILMVEDLPTDAEITERELKKILKSYILHKVETQEEYIAELDTFKPDIIISDYRLPDFNGLEVLKIALQKAPDIPVIIVTGSLNEDTAVECMKAGASDYVIKEHIRRLGTSFLNALEKKKTRIQKENAEAELKKSEEKNKQFLRNFIGIAYQINLSKRKPIFFEGTVEEITGYTPEDFLNEKILWHLIIIPDDIEFVQKEREKMVAVPDYIADNEYRIIHKSGEIRWVRDLARKIAGETKESDIIQGAIYDITRRKKAEEEKLEMERKLLHVQKLESLGVLAGGIAHDFNNILMAILGNLDLALLDISPLAPARSIIERAMNATRRAADLTRQMLAYSGKGKFLIKKININDLIKENAYLFGASVPKNIKFDIRTDPNIPDIIADPSQIQQVIMNLITNASEAISDKNGIVTLSSGVDRFEKDTLKHSKIIEKPKPGNFVVIEVTDNGCGMDPETQQKMFEPFFSTKFIGRGLGMSAVLGIIRGHNGAILVDSSVGKGTSIKVLFPFCESLNKTEDQADEQIISDENHNLFKGTILVVDDEEIVLEMCKTILERLGFSILTAKNGIDAIEIFKQESNNIRCVLLDLIMPGKDGLDTFKDLKNIDRKVKVILSSGYNEQDTLEKFKDMGLAAFIQKPYLIKNLKETLRSVLG